MTIVCALNIREIMEVPLDCLRLIIENVEIRSLGQLARTSKLINEVCQDDYMWSQKMTKWPHLRLKKSWLSTYVKSTRLIRTVELRQYIGLARFCVKVGHIELYPYLLIDDLVNDIKARLQIGNERFIISFDNVTGDCGKGVAAVGSRGKIVYGRESHISCVYRINSIVVAVGKSALKYGCDRLELVL